MPVSVHQALPVEACRSGLLDGIGGHRRRPFRERGAGRCDGSQVRTRSGRESAVTAALNDRRGGAAGDRGNRAAGDQPAIQTAMLGTDQS